MIDLPDAAIIGLNVLLWAGWSLAVGYVAHRRPVRAFSRDTWLYRVRRFEAGGRLYERWGIRRWKDRLPEAGALFTGGLAKRQLAGHDMAAIERFMAETRRAEWTHWWITGITPAFALFNPPAVMPLIVLYALAVNGPCLVVQRYNRARLGRLLSGAERRAGRGSR